MSCPYLEKGIVARCRIFGKIGLRIEAREEETDCFSGDFSDCSFLYTGYSPKTSREYIRKAMPGLKHNMTERGGHE